MMQNFGIVAGLVYLEGSPRRTKDEGNAMAKLRVKFTFPPERIREPVIYEVGKRFDLVTNIRRADITAEVAWAVLELDGERNDIDAGIKWVESIGVRVDPIEDSILEG
jgi:hypothetical protein